MEVNLTTYLIIYGATLAVFLGIDVVWLKLVVLDIFESRIGSIMRDQPLIGVAAGFYAAYVAGAIYFASAPVLGNPGLQPGDYAGVFVRGAILGLLAYGTYEFTSMSIMKDWTWNMVILDTIWGGVLTGFSTVAGLWITRLML